MPQRQSAGQSGGVVQPPKVKKHKPNRNKVGLDPVPPDKHCNGQKSNGSGNLCRMPAGYRTSHLGFGRCIHHGGKTPSGTKAAIKQMVHASIGSYAGVELDIDPIDALLGEVRRTAGHVAWLQERISEWTMDVSVEMTETHSTWLQVYQYERMHLARTSKIAIDAGVAQRQVALAESQGQLLASAISQILDGLGLSADQKAMVPELVPQVLRAIAVRADKPASPPADPTIRWENTRV